MLGDPRVFGLHLGADLLGTATLPDNGVVERHTCLTIPGNAGLALIGDAQAGNLPGLNTRHLHHLADDSEHVGHDLLSIVLNKAVVMDDLTVRARRFGNQVARVREEHGLGTLG